MAPGGDVEDISGRAAGDVEEAAVDAAVGPRLDTARGDGEEVLRRGTVVNVARREERRAAEVDLIGADRGDAAARVKGEGVELERRWVMLTAVFTPTLFVVTRGGGQAVGDARLDRDSGQHRAGWRAPRSGRRGSHSRRR